MQPGLPMLRALRLLSILTVAAALGACQSGSETDSGNSAQPNQAADQSPASPWTTLGTRAQPSAPERPITRNAGARWQTYDPAPSYPKTVTRPTRYISMPDGTQLAVYVTLPATADGKAVTTPLPTVLIQTSYNGGSTGQAIAGLGGADPYIVKHGYATVVVDVRGTGQSGGSWQAFGPKEQSDYGQVVDWVTQQPFSNGKIGVYGVSYLGITAIITAAQDHPAVKAAMPIVPIGDGYRDIVFTGGQVNPTFIPLWLTLVTGLGVTDPVALTDPQQGLPIVLEHLTSALTQFQLPIILKALLGDTGTAYDGDFWAQRSPLEHDGDIHVPTFIVGGLHDLFQRSEPISYEEIKNQAPAKLLIGPWTHVQAAFGEGLPADGVPALNHIELQWFDQYVKGKNVGANAQPNVTQYVLGHGHYVTATDWPPLQAQAQRLYLQAGKRLSTEAPADSAAPHTIANVPLDGLCSISASQWTAGLLGYTNLPCFTDDNIAELLSVKFDTAPMPADYYINGPIEADLWIASNSKDAQLSVRVADVAPDGSATPLTNGLQTASFRAVDKTRSRSLDGEMIQPWHPYTKASAQPLTPNKPALVRVEVFPTSALIAKGHKLRIAVGPSNVAQGLPPLPTLLNIAPSAVTMLYNDAAHPSSVVFPVVPSSALNTQ